VVCSLKPEAIFSDPARAGSYPAIMAKFTTAFSFSEVVPAVAAFGQHLGQQAAK